MRKIDAIVYGKEGCHLCENRMENLRAVPARFKKATGEDLEVNIQYWDISTMEGLCEFCKESRSNSDIPIVVLTENKQLLKVWNGPKDPLSTRSVIEILQAKSLVLEVVTNTEPQECTTACSA